MRRLRLFPMIAPLIAGLVLTVSSAGCSKSAGTNEKPEGPGKVAGEPATEKIAVPGSKGAATGGPTDDSRNRLQPEEGSLAIQAPSDAKAGAEAVAKVVVTPGEKYKVNVEFPTKLTLKGADGVQIAKAELRAGGQDKEKGDAEVFDESNLTFAVKLTPAKSGSYTITGDFKFAVCDKAGSTCLAKKEAIAIQVAAQ